MVSFANYHKINQSILSKYKYGGKWTVTSFVIGHMSNLYDYQETAFEIFVKSAVFVSDLDQWRFFFISTMSTINGMC